MYPLPQAFPRETSVLESGHRSGWILAIVLSGLLNITLFGIMPGMIQKLPEKPDILEKIQTVNIIQDVRLNRLLPPPEKPESSFNKKQPVSKQEENPQGTRTKTRTLKTKTLKAKLPMPKPELPLELNHTLPRSKITLDMQPFEIKHQEITHQEITQREITHQDMPAPEPLNLNVPIPRAHYSAKELDSSLIPLAKPSPVYPLKASRRGIQGWVKIKFIVNTSGFVKDLEIIQANPARVFDKSVIECVAQWKFKPGIVEGIPVSTLVTTFIKFQLE
jgi:protein TonB